MKRAIRRQPEAQTAASIIAAAPDLFDPYAPDEDPLQPDPINWSDEVTNGISLAPSIGWMPGDPQPEACGSPALAGIADLRPEPSAPALTIVPKRCLREHISEVDAIADTIEAMDDEELTEEAKSELTLMLRGAIAGTKKKVDATSAVMARLEHRAEAQKAERDLLDKGLKRSLRQLKRLSDHVLEVLDTAGLDRIEGEVSTLARRRNPPSVVPDTSLAGPLARDFVREPTQAPWEPDKTLIKSAIGAGREIPGWATVRPMRLVRS